MVAVTFPDSGCANFYVKSPRVEDETLIDAIARSFHPTGEIRAGAMCK